MFPPARLFGLGWGTQNFSIWESCLNLIAIQLISNTFKNEHIRQSILFKTKQNKTINVTSIEQRVWFCVCLSPVWISITSPHLSGALCHAVVPHCLLSASMPSSCSLNCSLLSPRFCLNWFLLIAHLQCSPLTSGRRLPSCPDCSFGYRALTRDSFILFRAQYDAA